MNIPIQLNVNGDSHTTFVDTREPLLDVLRYKLATMGPQEGGGNGNCGACTVVLDGTVVNACLVFAAEADGAAITTVEGVEAEGNLHPVQRAFIDEIGLQCGVCTPGFIMSAKALLERNPDQSEKEIRLALSGNLCRCTGYDKNVRAVQAASKALSQNA